VLRGALPSGASPVQYAKRVVGRKVMAGQSTRLAVAGDAGGVDASHLRVSILYLPHHRRRFEIAATSAICFRMLGWASRLYIAVCAGIIFFPYFYVSSFSTPAKSQTIADSTAAVHFRDYVGQAPADYINEVLSPHHAGRALT